MAYLYRKTDEESEAPSVTGRLASAAPIAAASGASGAPGAAPAAGQAAPASPAFVGFDRYFAANKQTAGNTAEKLAGGIERDARKASTGAMKMAGDFYKQATASGLGAPVGKYVTHDGQAIEGQSGKPISLAEADALAGRTYTGPRDLSSMSGYDAAYNAAKSAQERVVGVGTHSGIAAQLGTMQSGPYSQGSRDLDAALTNRAGASQFNRLRSQYSGLSSYLDNANTAAGEHATRMDAGVARSAGAYRNMANVFRSGEADEALQKQERVAAAQAEARRFLKLVGDAQRRKWAEKAAKDEVDKEKHLEEERERGWRHRGASGEAFSGGSIT